MNYNETPDCEAGRRFHVLPAVLAGLWLAVTGIPQAANATIQPASALASPPIFGTQEIGNANLAPFRKWTGMLDRQALEQPLYDGPCTARRFNRCHLQEWRELLADLANEDRLTQLYQVNRFMNRVPYITDPVNYGLPDYWATPLQFAAKDGDCEDYAIAKYFSLKALGVPASDMRIVVLDDLNLRIPHAVLVVYLEGRALVLDNQISRVVTADSIRHYRPVYSINEQGWWLHRP